MEVGQKLLDDFGLRAALGDKLADARKPDGDEREFDGCEETVEGHQHQNSDDPDQEHTAAKTSKRHCNSRFGQRAEGMNAGCRTGREGYSGHPAEMSARSVRLRGVA